MSIEKSQFDQNTDLKKAFEYYKKAADQGHCDAQYNVGCLYEGGREGAPQDFNKAFEYYKKAADQGHGLAQYMVGCCYEEGEGVSQDFNKAFEYHVKAGLQGDDCAQGNAISLYRQGKVIPQNQDVEKLLEWQKPNEKIELSNSESDEVFFESSESENDVAENAMEAVVETFPSLSLANVSSEKGMEVESPPSLPSTFQPLFTSLPQQTNSSFNINMLTDSKGVNSVTPTTTSPNRS